jgi:ABC-type transport system involved in multi-copper enzyme maturation permease subunit
VLQLLIEKELKAILQSPKFIATFGVCSILIMLSIFIGVREYRASLAQYEIATSLVDQKVAEATSFRNMQTKVYREPDPMQIFMSGVNYDVGRLSQIQSKQDVKLEQSAYSEDPLFAVFRYIDFAFIVQVVLSLFAIVFTYDAINGERESGTLKLVLSNAVPRAKYLIAKMTGAWLGLTIPLLIPILLGLLLLFLFKVPMTGSDWLKLTTLIGVSILYFTFFIALGLLVSSLTRTSSVSFLLLLVAWITLVLIVPRGATMAAGQLVNVPTVAEIESQKDRYRTDMQQDTDEQRHNLWEQVMAPAEGLPREERRAFYQANRSAFRELAEDLQTAMEEEIAEHNRQVNEGLRNAKSEQERLAFLLSRFSPASAYKLTAMNLGGTNTSIKKRYEDQMFAYRETYNSYVAKKSQQEKKARQEAAQKSRNSRMFRMTGSGNEAVDANDMPKFIASREPVGTAIKASILDFGLLSVFTVLAFAGAFLAFVRYDVR